MSAEVFTRGTPSAAGIDARGISAFLDALESDPGIHPHGLVMLRRGIVVAEGWWTPYSRDRVQLLYSLSKSFTATAVALARQEGLLELDAPVLSYFPELEGDIVDPRSRAMRVADLLAMSSGHAGDTIDLARARDPENLVRGFLLLPPDADPGTLFAYNQPCTYTLAAIVQRVTGLGLLDYLRPRLLDPLGIVDAGWIEAPRGQALGFSGLHATTDAVARLGELYRRGGLWGERRILDEEWVDLATRRHIPTPLVGGPDWEQGYGYQFWTARHGYRGDGAFGQYCVVVPEHELVVAITSETPDMQLVLDALWAHVLPALDRPATVADDAALAERLGTLAFPALGSAPGPTSPGEGRQRAASSSAAGVTAVRASFDDPDGGYLVLVDAAGELALGVGDARWIVQEVDGIPLAASGGLDAHGGFTVEVLLLETPHTLRVRGDAAGDTVDVEWLTTPLHDQSIRAQRRP